MPGLKLMGSGYSITKSLEAGSFQLSWSKSEETFLIDRMRLYSRPTFQPSHLTSSEHSMPSLYEKFTGKNSQTS